MDQFWTEILHCLSSAEVRLNAKALAIALTAFQNRSAGARVRAAPRPRRAERYVIMTFVMRRNG